MNIFPLFLRDSVPFVHRDDQSATALQRDPQHARILFGHGVVSVEHDNDDMSFVDRLQRLRDARTLNDLLNPGAATDTGRIDKQKVTVVAMEWNENGVSRRAGLVARDDALLAQ